MNLTVELGVKWFAVSLELATKLRRLRFVPSRVKTGNPPGPVGWSVELGPLTLYYERTSWRARA